jgi:hypothetical protein
MPEPRKQKAELTFGLAIPAGARQPPIEAWSTK